MSRHEGLDTEPAETHSDLNEVSGSVGRRGWAILGMIAVLSALPMIYYGASARVEYDGWWHVFIARSDVWFLFWQESFRSAHPPLYYLLLRAVSSLGTEPLVYRSISILAAAIGAMALGAATWRVSRTRAAAVTCALAFALATSTVIIANEVRSYMLATAWLLLALPPYLTLARPGGDARTRVYFAGFMILALLTHYGVMLVFLATVAAPFALCFGFPAYRRAWSTAFKARWRADLATLSPPAVLMTVAYTWHMALYRGPMAHLPDFYYSGEVPWWRFLTRNLVREIDLFSPVQLAGRGMLLQVLGVGIVLAIPLLLFWWVRQERREPLAALFPAILLLLTAAHMLGSIRGHYPFGGGLRHQFFLFPFAVATLFLFFDRLLARLPPVLPRRSAIVLLAAGVLLTAYAQWRALPRPKAPLFEREFAAFREAMPAPEAVYLDGFNLFAFFGHMQKLRWTFEGLSPDGRLQIWRVEDGKQTFLALRDQRHWNPPSDDPRLYGAIRTALDATGASSAATFRVDQVGLSSASTALGERRERSARIVEAARIHGLTPKKILDDRHMLFVELAVVDSGSPATVAAPVLVSGAGEGIRAESNPIQVCDGKGAGTATLYWSFPGRQIDIRIGAPDGKLWGSPPSQGSSTTGAWVQDGMTFYVQDRNTEPSTSPDSTLGTVVVRHTAAGCAGAGKRP